MLQRLLDVRRRQDIRASPANKPLATMRAKRPPEGYFRSQWKRIYWIGIPLLVALIAAWAGDLVARDIDPLNEFECDRQNQLGLRTPAPVLPNIAIIGYDSKSRERLPLYKDGAIDRIVYANLIRKLRRCGAKALLVDITFDLPRPESDRNLRAALHEPGTMGITLAACDFDEPADAPEEPDYQLWGYVDLGHLGADFSNEQVRAAANSSFRVVAHAIGAVAYRYDRRFSDWVFHASLSSVFHYLGLKESEIVFDRRRRDLYAGDYKWALQGNDAIRIHWTEDLTPFPTYDLADVMLQLSEEELASTFGGKLVLLGKREEAGDSVATPKGDCYGVEFLAQTANTLLLPPSLRLFDAEGYWHYSWCLFLAWGAGLSAMTRRTFWLFFGAPALLLAAALVPEAIVRMQSVLLETVAPVSGVIIAFSIGLAVRLLLPAPGRPAGSEFEATAVFVDLQGSTVLLRDLGPQPFRKLYADLSGRIATAARSFGGEVERTTGDGALVLFPADRHESHAYRALDACSAMAAAAREVGKRHGRSIGLSFGIESGRLTGAYVFEGGRRAWSSAGAAVNLAKRLQDATGDLGKSVAIGPEAFRRLGADSALVPAGEIEAQGFEGKVAVWTIAGEV